MNCTTCELPLIAKHNITPYRLKIGEKQCNDCRCNAAPQCRKCTVPLVHGGNWSHKRARVSDRLCDECRARYFVERRAAIAARKSLEPRLVAEPGELPCSPRVEAMMTEEIRASLSRPYHVRTIDLRTGGQVPQK